jgi:hypothetical protein
MAILTWDTSMERVTRIELALSAWEADVLPLNYTRVAAALRRAVRRIIPGHSARLQGGPAEVSGDGTPKTGQVRYLLAD